MKEPAIQSPIANPWIIIPEAWPRDLQFLGTMQQ